MDTKRFFDSSIFKYSEAKNIYIYIVSLEKTEYIRIIDIPKLWMKDPDIILLLKYRILGEPSTLVEIKGMAEEFNTQINGYNYENNQDFLDAINFFDDWQIEKIKENENTTGKSLLDMLSSPADNKLNIIIQDKYSKLPFGKYLDVSNLTQLKYLNTNKTKFVAKHVRIMSTNYNNFYKAISSFPNGIYKYNEDLINAKKYFDIDDHDNTQISNENIISASVIETGVPIKLVKKTKKYVPKKKSFLQELSLLTTKNILDVSNIDNKGNGYIKINTSLIPKNYFIGLNIKLTSDNYESFKTAVKLIPNGPTKYAEDLEHALLFFGEETEEPEETEEESS
jgi:hypothetical protein